MRRLVRGLPTGLPDATVNNPKNTDIPEPRNVAGVLFLTSAHFDRGGVSRAALPPPGPDRRRLERNCNSHGDGNAERRRRRS